MSPAPGPGSIRAALPLVVTAVLTASLTTGYVLGPYYRSFNTPHTPIEGVPHEPSPVAHAPGLARRLVFVVMDGVSFEGARAMPELAPLRRAGVLRPLRAEFPTYTASALTSMVTGLSPRDSGTRLNGGIATDNVQGLDSFLVAAGDANVPIRLRTREWEPFEGLMRPPPSADIHKGRIGFLTELMRPELPRAALLPPIDGRSPTREITIIYCGEIDEAAHHHGTRSAAYAEAERDVGAVITRLAGTLNFNHDSLLIASDHGHRVQGGHGGVEPEVTSAFLLGVGGFLRRGVELAEERPIRDLAATLSLLAGVRVPTSNLGRPMLDLLSLDDAATSLVFAAPFDQAARFLCRLAPSARCAEVGPLVARLEKPDPTAWEEATALQDALSRERDRGLDARATADTFRRLGLASLALAIGAVLIWLRRGRLELRRHELTNAASWATPLLNALVYMGLLAVAGYRPTFSTLKASPDFTRDATPAVLVATAAVVGFALLTRPARLAPWILLLATAVPFVLLAASVGCDPAALPNPIRGALIFELGPGVLSAAIAAAALALIGVVRARRAATGTG